MNNSFPFEHILDFVDSDDESDRCTEASSTNLFAGSDASSRTSESISDASMRSVSPTQSVLSVTSTLREDSIADDHGRGINTSSEVYRLPADAAELARLDQQHEMLKVIAGSYSPPTHHVLANEWPEERKAILDLGCGSGRWIIEAANDFPHCSAVAIDLIPMESANMPSNCRMERDDINIGLEHFYGDFNLVHARLICTGIRDYGGLIQHISHVLRPGGLIDLLEYDFQVHNEHRQLVTVSTGSMGAPWLPRFLTLIKNAAGRRGGTLDAARNLYNWVKDTPAFTEVVHRQIWTPASPWLAGSDPETQKLNQHGALMRDDVMEFLEAGRPLLLNSGLPEEFVDEIQQNSRRELAEARIPYYILLEHVYAIRR